MTAKAKKKIEAESVEAEPIISYKGFAADWKCRDFQYEIGKYYEHKGDVEACSSGFHACEYPLDVFAYYPPLSSSFAIVEQSGKIAKHSGDSKIASSQIKIKAAINLAGIINAAIEYTFARAKPIDPASPASATGWRGAASATGWSGAASATGLHSVAMASGANGKACGVIGTAIVLVNRASDGSILHIRASKIGENGLKADIWYSLDDAGEFVEAT